MTRREKILRILSDKGQITYLELEKIFPDISNMTLRRDLIGLEKEGQVVRTRGGAVARAQIAVSAENAYSLRTTENVDAKMQIAQKAKTLIRPGRAVYLDSGTTMMCFARIIPDDNLYIITSGPNIALEVMRDNNLTLLMLGGNLNRNNLSVSGTHSLEMVEKINIDIAFLVASGYDRENGFTCGTFSESELKRAIMQKARQTVLLMDSSKIERSMPFTFSAFEDIDIFVTDDNMPQMVLDEARSKGIIVL